jgi:hypothetical protein
MSRHPLVTSRRALLVGGAVAVVASPLRAEASAAGNIQSLHGFAFAETASSRRALQPSADVFVGDLVETEINSGLIMRLGTSTMVKLGALAKFRIDKFVVDAGGVLDLYQSALVIDRNDNAKSQRLQVRSPFALIAARGTMFFAGPSKDVFGVFVGRGIVTVTGGGRTVTLRAGQGTDIVKAGSAPSNPKAWTPERISTALASVG